MPKPEPIDRPALPASWSEDAFLSWAERQDGRHELVEGAVRMQAGASRDHERIAKRMFAALYAQVDEATFDVNKGDFGVRIRPHGGRGSVLYPDVLVDLQDRRGGERATSTALVIVEVLSPSTDLAHHVAKLERYKAVPSLRRYLVLDQAAPVARVWARSEAGWPAEPELIGAGGTLDMPEVGAAVPMAELYRPVAPRRPV